MRYIGKAVLNEYEDLFSKQGRPPENADYAEDRYYTDVFYHDIRLAYSASEDFDFYLGVDNLGNRLPPQGLSGTGAGSGLYDVVGRTFYAGVKLNLAGLGL
jgi:outer membrane receptor protein involved in Fe transport